MRLTQIRVFLTVLESGSIRAAARKLEVSPPAVSKSIRQLEEELHVQLLKRTQHGVIASPAGQALAVRARVIQSELSRAEMEVAQLSGGGSVAFGVGPTGMMLIVPQAVAHFRRRYPDARVRVVEGRRPTLVAQVRDETLDFALGLETEIKHYPGIAFRPLFRHEEVVVARRGHPLLNARSLAQLRDAQWLNNLPGAVPNELLSQAFLSAGLPAPRSAIECDSILGIVALLVKTDMLAIMSRRVLESPLARDVLKEISVAERLPSIHHGIFMRTDAPPTQMAAAMARSVTAAARLIHRN